MRLLHLAIGAAVVWYLWPKTARAASGPLPSVPKAKARPQKRGGETPVETAAREETWARSQAPQGWQHQYYYGTHWAFEYVHNPPEQRFYLVYFDGHKGWTGDPNHLA